jgi:hypothetical protein
MKRNIIYILITCSVLFACKKEDKLTFNSPDNIYLNYKLADTVIYSFAYEEGKERDTVWIPVIVSGKRAPRDRSFVLSVVDTATTALSPLHYEALKPSYILPADSGTIRVPIILKNTDPELDSKSLLLTVIVSGDKDFKTQLPQVVRQKTILFSNRLERPDWWESWEDQLGVYSRTKHQLFLISSGTRDLINVKRDGDPNFQIPRNLFFIENARVFLRDPFGWIQQHPEKNYVLTKRPGTADYDFYNINTPDKKITLKFIDKVGEYFFIDSVTGEPLTM